MLSFLCVVFNANKHPFLEQYFNMKLETFEQHIEREYRLERTGMCLECDYVCWLHNPLLHCKYLEDYLNQSPEIKPKVTEVEGYGYQNDNSALRKSPLYKDKDSGQLLFKNKWKEKENGK